MGKDITPYLMIFMIVAYGLSFPVMFWLSQKETDEEIKKMNDDYEKFRRELEVSSNEQRSDDKR